MIFLDRSLHRLRPVAVAVLVSDYVQRDFRRHAARLAAAPDIYWGVVEADGDRCMLAVRSGQRGAIQAIDVRGLLGWARKHGRLVVFRHSIGDFVPAHGTLIEVYGGDALHPAEPPVPSGFRQFGPLSAY